MRRPNPSLLYRLLRRATAPARSQVAILLYHRIYQTAVDPWELCVSPPHFAEHLEVLRTNYPIMRLDDLVTSLEEGCVPKRGVVVTFDDGYGDNFANAKPLLEEFKVPATIFVASDSLDSPIEFWWDALERVVLQPESLPERLELHVEGRVHAWPTANVRERERAYMSVHHLLQPLRASERNPIMSEILTWARVAPVDRPDYRPLTSGELIQMAQSEFVTIGAHTMSHAFLSAIAEEEQYDEMAGSRDRLQEITGCGVDTFSYPYGNVTCDTVRIAERAGFKAAVTMEAHPVEAGANPLQLGRLPVGDWSREEFKHHLGECFRT
jgi:peptidoglycan/xylan/chitin deacetylase (PgdA/CDA1 family)